MYLKGPDDHPFARQAVGTTRHCRSVESIAVWLGWLQLRQTKVEQLHARIRQHDVGWLQVAVDDSSAMGLDESAGDLGRMAQDQVEW